MADIEVVGDGGGSGGGAKQGVVEGREVRANGGEADPVVDMYSAAAYGDLERLRGFVEREGGGGGASLAAPDGNGYHALQWAALNNYPQRRSLHHRGPAALLHGRDVNARDNAQQTAQHWAAVRGAIAAAEQEMNGGGEVEYWDEWITVFGFRNELPDPSFKLKWLPLNKDKDRNEVAELGM